MLVLPDGLQESEVGLQSELRITLGQLGGQFMEFLGHYELSIILHDLLQILAESASSGGVSHLVCSLLLELFLQLPAFQLDQGWEECLAGGEGEGLGQSGDHRQQGNAYNKQMSLLNDKWTYWFDDLNEKPQRYQSTLQVLEEFDTIEKFWQIFNSLPKISEIPQNCSLILMKHSIKPQWEDSSNYYGQIAKYRVSGEGVEDLWKELSIFLISLEFCEEYEEESINGISVKVKQGEQVVLEVWTKAKEVEEPFRKSFDNHTAPFLRCHLDRIRTYNCADLIKSHKLKSKRAKR